MFRCVRHDAFQLVNVLSQVRSADEISVFLDSKVHKTGIAGLDITNV